MNRLQYSSLLCETLRIPDECTLFLHIKRVVIMSYSKENSIIANWFPFNKMPSHFIAECVCLIYENICIASVNILKSECSNYIYSYILLRIVIYNRTLMFSPQISSIEESLLSCSAQRHSQNLCNYEIVETGDL